MAWYQPSQFWRRGEKQWCCLTGAPHVWPPEAAPLGQLLHGALGTSQRASLDAVVCRPGTGASLRAGAAGRDSGAGSLGPLAGSPSRSSRSCHRCKGASSQEHTCPHWLLDWHAVQGQTARMRVACTVSGSVMGPRSSPEACSSAPRLGSQAASKSGSRSRRHRREQGCSKPQIWASLFRVLITASLCGQQGAKGALPEG